GKRWVSHDGPSEVGPPMTDPASAAKAEKYAASIVQVPRGVARSRQADCHETPDGIVRGTGRAQQARRRGRAQRVAPRVRFMAPWNGHLVLRLTNRRQKRRRSPPSPPTGHQTRGRVMAWIVLAEIFPRSTV